MGFLHRKAYVTANDSHWYSPNPDKPELTNDEWRIVVSLRSVYYITINRLTFILFLFLFLRVRFLVSVFRIWDCVYLSWHLKPDTWNQIRGTKTI